jgi:glycosyltransferase involved in cell wall biosynthesis
MKKHRVALDARRLHGLRRGIGQYVSQLVRHLPSLAPDMELLLFVDRPLDVVHVPTGCRQVLVGKPFTTDSQSLSGLGAKLRSYDWMNRCVPAALVRESVDLFHATNFALPARRPCPCVVTIHDLIYARAPGAFEPLYEQYLRLTVPMSVRRAEHVITDSAATRDDLIQVVRPDPERVSVIHLGVGEEYRVVEDGTHLETVRKQLQLPKRFVLHVGAIERRKKIETLVRAVEPLLNRGLLDAVVLAGEEGHGAADVHRTATELGVQDRVLCLGYVEQDVMPALYNLALVLSLASVYEGFGMPVLESMACGTPTVTSDVSSLPEVAGDAALIVSPGDVLGLGNAIERLITDSDLRLKMRQRGISRAHQFGWERTAAHHAAVYRRVLQSGDSR